ncbi:MAG: dihydropteroate synthase [Xanthomonadales bacterium]|jgi:dihydropteroate synthase|nr:dihydropteroate synthase [Xanthomonadales bacterium]
MTRVMGILNTTPDSFSDGGLWADRNHAVEHALAMVSAGADIIDVGGESTRPGARSIGVQEEMDRVLPVVEAIVAQATVTVSVDTSKPEVMKAAVAAGAGLVNDVFALRQDGALETAAGLGVPVCLMHMQGRPRDMQSDPRYADVVTEVEAFLVERALACEAAGISRARILIDPGFGFGKSLQHNIDLFRALPRLCGGDYPVLVGVSRKSMLGALTGKPVEDRLAASVAAAVLAARHGAAVVRVHDVAETVDALKVLQVLETAVHPSR